MSLLFVAGIEGFDSCHDYLVWCGHQVRRPRTFGSDTKWVVEHADAVIMLPGWQQSRAAVAIKMVAENCCLPVSYYWPDELHGHRVKEEAQPAVEPDVVANVVANSLGEIRVVNQVTGGEKGRKPARFELIPPASLAEVAEVYGVGAAKYADRNWERGVDWSLMFGAMMRHMWLWWGGETDDVESGRNHLAHAAFHVLGLLQLSHTHPGLDDRPFTGKE